MGRCGSGALLARVKVSDDHGVSAAPQLFPNEPESGADPNATAMDGQMTVREAAGVLGVAESTLRRTIKQAADKCGSTIYAAGSYRGRGFTAMRDGDRLPWQVVFDKNASVADDVSHEAVARVDGRIAELRVAMLPVAQEPALEHVAERRWWKFWGKS